MKTKKLCVTLMSFLLILNFLAIEPSKAATYQEGSEFEFNSVGNDAQQKYSTAVSFEPLGIISSKSYSGEKMADSQSVKKIQDCLIEFGLEPDTAASYSDYYDQNITEPMTVNYENQIKKWEEEKEKNAENIYYERYLYRVTYRTYDNTTGELVGGGSGFYYNKKVKSNSEIYNMPFITDIYGRINLIGCEKPDDDEDEFPIYRYSMAVDGASLEYDKNTYLAKITPSNEDKNDTSIHPGKVSVLPITGNEYTPNDLMLESLKQAIENESVDIGSNVLAEGRMLANSYNEARGKKENDEIDESDDEDTTSTSSYDDAQFEDVYLPQFEQPSLKKSGKNIKMTIKACIRKYDVKTGKYKGKKNKPSSMKVYLQKKTNGKWSKGTLKASVKSTKAVIKITPKDAKSAIRVKVVIKSKKLDKGSHTQIIPITITKTSSSSK